MIDVRKVAYRVVVISGEGVQYDVTGITSGLGWSESEGELSARITCKLACVNVGGKALTALIQPLTPIIIYADFGVGEYTEVIRGNVSKLELTESNGEYSLEIDGNDECQALRHNQDDLYFTADHKTSAILGAIFEKWGVPYRIEVEECAHSKKAYRHKYLSDMVTDVLKDLKEKTGKEYIMRASKGIVEVIGRGTNKNVYHFDVEDNVVRVREKYDISRVVTRVLVGGKSRDEGKQVIEATVDGKLEYGIRQVYYTRGDKETLEEATKAAEKILEEQGNVERATNLECADVPEIRKGDLVRVGKASGDEYFYVKGVTHNAATQRMTLELTEAKERNTEGGTEYDTSSGGSSPP